MDERARSKAFSGLARFYAAVFAVLGVYMQFFPVWLHDARGLDEATVTLVLSGQIWSRTVAGPLWAQHVDRSGDARRTLAWLCALSMLVALAYAAASGTAVLFCCSVAFGLVYPPMHSILDSLAVESAHRCGFSFPRVRLFGSASFLVAIAAVGALLPHIDNRSLVWILAGGMALSLLAAAGLPTFERPHPLPASGVPIRLLLSQWRFVGFLLAAGLIQGSHSAYYSLSTLHWRRHGVEETTAALLWGEGIVAEIVLFFFIRDRAERLRPTTLMLLGAGGAIARWLLLASTTAVPLLAAGNWLHGVSFGCTFLGSLRFIRIRVAPGHQATAQGLLGAASSGVLMAVATLLAGQFYAHSGAGAFVAMAVLALLGGLLALLLRRRRRN